MQKKRFLSSSILILLFLLSGIFIEKNNLLYSLFHKDQPFSPLTSNARGYPVLDNNGRLSIFLLDRNKIIKTDIISMQGNGDRYKGTTNPVSAPNSLYTAFIDKENADLWVMSNETLKKNQITRNGRVADFITAWSPDSKKILFEAGTNINNLGEGRIDHGNLIITKPRFSSSIFFLYSLQTGELTEIPELNSIEGFFDNDTVLVNGNGDLGKPLTGQISIFNFHTHKFNNSALPNLNIARIDDFAISPDHKKWVIFTPHSFTFKKGNDQYFAEDKQEILANFPETSGETLITGDFGNFGNPIFSPDSSKMVFYTKQQQSSVTTSLVVYDLFSKNSRIYQDGVPIRWIDNESLIVASFQTNDLYFLNLQTGERIPINIGKQSSN